MRKEIFLMMQSLFILKEITTSGLNYFSLTIISALSIACGVFVIISKNPIVSVLFLIGLFLCIALYLMTIGLTFIGLSYLLVYVGAVSILFLFILMLLNIRVSELMGNSVNSMPLAIMIGLFFYRSVENYESLGEKAVIKSSKIEYAVVETSNFEVQGNGIIANSIPPLVSSNLWDGRLAETFHITSIGNIIYTSYPMWLILTSVILLLAMVGSIVITTVR